jgi:hypothetical protein
MKSEKQFRVAVERDLREQRRVGVRVPESAMLAARYNLDVTGYANTMSVRDCADLLYQFGERGAGDAARRRGKTRRLGCCQGERLAYLFDRWQDESEYEDWAEYETAMRALLPAGWEFVNATKRPFGVRFSYPPTVPAIPVVR